jgi:lysophospholipase L1-like esterase
MNRVELVNKETFPLLSHGQSTVFLGSCFSDELGTLVRSHGFETLVNPGGTIFHPLALAKLIRWCFDSNMELRVFQHEDMFFSWDCAGSVFGMSTTELTEKLARLRQDLKSALQRADFLFVTFGTAWAYRLKSDQETVANCHKQTASLFQKEHSSVEEIVHEWKEVFTLLKTENPKLHGVITVSPVRHVKDGFIENNRSKARLLLAAELLQKLPGVYYFSSYEFVLDELRDYRYFKTDGIHPNEIAIQELWHYFQSSFCSEETKRFMEEWQSIRQAEQHKILYPKSQAARKHMESTMKRKAQFLAAHPLFYVP